jgi:hypothetical protein
VLLGASGAATGERADAGPRADGLLDGARDGGAGAADGWRRAVAGTPEARAIAAQAGSPILALRESDFARELAQAREHSVSQFEIRDAIVASSVAVTTSLSIGYVVWVLRGGVLLTSLLASMPAWRSIDPLPVLARIDARGRDDSDEDDSLRGLLRSAARCEAEAAGSNPRREAGPGPGADRAAVAQVAHVAHVAEPT